jgi:predicted nucleic acid-binding protein
MIEILVDATLVLDVLLDRQPHADAAAAVWTAIELGRAEGLLPAHAVATIYEQSVRALGAARAHETVRALLSVFGVAGVDEVVLRAALAIDLPDFADAVTVAAAQRAKCTVLVTRQSRHFRKAPMRALTPEEAGAWLSARDAEVADPASTG